MFNKKSQKVRLKELYVFCHIQVIAIRHPPLLSVDVPLFVVLADHRLLCSLNLQYKNQRESATLK